jgi:hypothetical protein
MFTVMEGIQLIFKAINNLVLVNLITELRK